MKSSIKFPNITTLNGLDSALAKAEGLNVQTPIGQVRELRKLMGELLKSDQGKKVLKLLVGENGVGG